MVGDTGSNDVTLAGTDTAATVHGGALINIDGTEDSVYSPGGATIAVASDLNKVDISASYSSIYEGKDDVVAVYGKGDTIYTGGHDSNGGSYYSTGSGGAAYDGSGGGGSGGGGYSGGGGSGGSGGSDDFTKKASVLTTSSTAQHTSVLTQAEIAAAAKASVGATSSSGTSTTPTDVHTSTMTTAEAALLRARAAEAATGTPGAATTPEFEGPKWEASVAGGGAAAAKAAKPVITWSFATGSSPTDGFSSYIAGQYKETVEKAVQAWAKASGLTFTEVADSSSSDIRIGWGNFETAQTGLVGRTGFDQTNGAFQPGAIIRLEDPGITALTKQGGQLTYSGTGATLYQVAVHEIGHALGLADDSDPSSVMYASSSSTNQKLDATDIKGIQELYGTSSKTAAASPASPLSSVHASGVNQLIQAMASFAPKQATAPLSTIIAASALAPTLAAPARR